MVHPGAAPIDLLTVLAELSQFGGTQMGRFVSLITSRRSFLRGITATAAVGATSPIATVVAADDTTVERPDAIESITGHISALGKEHMVLHTASGQVDVRPAPTVRMYCGCFGAVASIADFIVGDWVGAVGKLSGITFFASHIGSIFKPTTLTVATVDTTRQVLVTDQGRLDTSRQILPDVGDADAVDISKLSTGSTIRSAICWRHPATGDAYLLGGLLA